MNSPKNSAKSLPTRASKEWATLGIKAYVLLMLDFLRLSPSYALARSVALDGLPISEAIEQLGKLYEMERKKPLTPDELVGIASDFDKVMETFADFGDVSRDDFPTWWQERGIDIYGYDHARPRVTQISRLDKDQTADERVLAELQQYLAKSRKKQGLPPTLFLAIPLGVPKRQLMKRISSAIDATGVELPPKAKRAKRALSAQRLRSKPLFMYLELLMMRAVVPKAPLWKLGLMANVSPKHAEGLSETGKATAKTADQRINMAILTSRALRKAKVVAENAARGEFPSSNPRPLPHFDWKEVFVRMRIARPKRKRQASQASSQLAVVYTASKN